MPTWVVVIGVMLLVAGMFGTIIELVAFAGFWLFLCWAGPKLLRWLGGKDDTYGG